MKKKLIPCLYCKNGQAMQDFKGERLFADGDLVKLAKGYGNLGADELLLFDLSVSDTEHDASVRTLIKICDESEIPVIGAGNVRRMEDVKKILYAGAQAAVLNFSKQGNVELIAEVSKRFGKDKIWVSCFSLEEIRKNRELIEAYASRILCPSGLSGEAKTVTAVPLVLLDLLPKTNVAMLLASENVEALTGTYISDPATDLMAVKAACKASGIKMNTFESAVPWSAFKLNKDGMIPVIVQDYKTSEVLMLAYMNEEAFNRTLETGCMTYWSRSRNELWMKGLTSGHFQYVKSLDIDCDNDTLLAKVSQTGAACHTGNYSCFYRNLAKKEYDDTNPLKVFQEVYDVIADRKIHPKDGSYTNYLFDKGIDKILKKCGEECTEIVIAAKNPDKEEIKYEISDFLYHVMVLMVEKGVTWEEITRELARR